ncbi:unnamed protein product [Rhodiola kirilowii]
MSWHASPRADMHRMVHPSDGESWKHFDRCHPSFASEPRNVRLGLCIDGFNPWGMSTKQYSIWPVMVTPYNLTTVVMYENEIHLVNYTNSLAV